MILLNWPTQDFFLILANFSEALKLDQQSVSAIMWIALANGMINKISYWNIFNCTLKQKTSNGTCAIFVLRPQIMEV